MTQKNVLCDLVVLLLVCVNSRLWNSGGKEIKSLCIGPSQNVSSTLVIGSCQCEGKEVKSCCVVVADVVCGR